jgi:hypothetical protein
MTPLAASKWIAVRIAALALALGVGPATSIRADDGGGGAGGAPAAEGEAGGCPEGTGAYLAMGQWKGDFRLVFQPVFPGVPEGLNLKVTWSGEIGFAVHRPEKDDPPPPPASNRRRPLAPPLKEGEKPPVVQDPASDRAAPGQFKTDEEQIEAAYAWFREQARLEEEAAAKRAERYGIEIPPASGSVEQPQIEGGGRGKSEYTINGRPMPDVHVKSGGRTSDATIELRAVEEQGDRPLRRIEVWGDRAQLAVSYDITAKGRGGSASTSGTSPKGSGGRVLLTYLEIENLQCGVVSGHIDATAIREQMRKGLPGTDIRVIENTWTARRDDRDESLEQKVQALVDQPIPAQLSWGYLDEFTKQAGELRKSAKQDDYSRCVLKALEGKFVKICRAFMRELGRNFPNAEHTPSCEVIRQAVLPIVEMQRSLELYGAGGCPESAEAWGHAEKQIQRHVRFLLQGEPTFLQLSCLKSLDAANLMGEASEAFNAALRAAEIGYRGER